MRVRERLTRAAHERLSLPMTRPVLCPLAYGTGRSRCALPEGYLLL
jgi:hypothetical protein